MEGLDGRDGSTDLRVGLADKMRELRLLIIDFVMRSLFAALCGGRSLLAACVLPLSSMLMEDAICLLWSMFEFQLSF